MYKSRSNFVRRVKKGSFGNIKLWDDSISVTGFKGRKKQASAFNLDLTLKEVGIYTDRIKITCCDCANSGFIDTNDLQKKYSADIQLKVIKDKFVCSRCKSKQINIRVPD